MARRTLTLAAVMLAGLIGEASAVSQATSQATAALAADFLGLAPFPQPPTPAEDALEIRLGYGIYHGSHENKTGLNVWKGIGYAAPPVKDLRWKAPRPPNTNLTVVNADTFGPTCPVSPSSGSKPRFSPGNEDCLYLNVYAPADSTVANSSTHPPSKLPVLVWIHGGGYGEGDGRSDMSALINDNNNEFIVVSIQYRLGAFGWLSSADVKKNGVVNAGLLDQVYALMWVQNYIGLFGGDPDRVTISGESAGGGSVMYHTLGAAGHSQIKLFRNAIAASPYLVPQYNYDASVPTQRYHAFATAAGCGSSSDIFSCLVAADTMALQYASSNVSATQTAYATWAFVPVTDGAYVRERASAQLATAGGAGNGVNIMVGNNADEGSYFVPTNISSDASLLSWIQATFPGLSHSNVTALLAAYSTSTHEHNNGSSSTYDYPLKGPLFETNGIGSPTANDVSQAAAGPQQRAYNMYAEATFVCPAYWLANAFTLPEANHSSTNNTRGNDKRTAFQYQYSVPFASHGADVSAYLGPPANYQGPGLALAFRRIWGGLVVRDDPSILAAPSSKNSSKSSLPAMVFPPWTPNNHSLVNLNQTGGVPVSVNASWGGVSIQYHEPGLRNDFTVADAETWEGGRAKRCAFWLSVGQYLPQ